MAHWIQNASKRMKKKGTEGSFTRIAKRMGMSTGAAARHIMAHKDDFSPSTVKKANFARNVAK
ncbi:MAG: helix-turn-helix domain-containing protein [Terriglobia bacterium]